MVTLSLNINILRFINTSVLVMSEYLLERERLMSTKKRAYVIKIKLLRNTSAQKNPIKTYLNTCKTKIMQHSS